MYPAFQDFIRDVWQSKPSMIILLIGGLVLFVLLVIDTHQHRRKRKERHRIRHFH